MIVALVIAAWIIAIIVSLVGWNLFQEQGRTIEDQRQAINRLYADYQAAITALCAKNGERVILPSLYTSENIPIERAHSSREPLAPAWASKDTGPALRAK